MLSRVLISCYLLLINIFIFGQSDTTKDEMVYQPPIPVELMIGNEALLFKMVVTKPINNSSFKFYNLLTLNSNFIDASASNLFNQTVLFYDLTPTFSAGLGSNYSSYSNLKPVVSALYSNFKANRGFIVQPTLVLEENGAKELFSMFQYVYILNPKKKVYFRIDLFTSWKQQHDFSYLNWRIGLSEKFGNFGPAVNVSFVGDNVSHFYNFGAFFNILI